jgi:hypothetical protein
MKVGLVAVDTVNFPNLPLMKLSAYHKARGDEVRLFASQSYCEADRVYMSKIFTFTPDFEKEIHAKEIIKSGTGYYYPDGGEALPDEIEHVYPDYGLYGIEDAAYGFLTRGCPRQCGFCIVSKKEGAVSKKVAGLGEFWKGQKEIVLLDPNILACKDHMSLLDELRLSGARVHFTQGMDIRLTTPENIALIKQIKIKRINFAWDNYRDRETILPKFMEFRKMTGFGRSQLGVSVLGGFDSGIEEDIERVEILHKLGYSPYFMVYERYRLPPDHVLRKIQLWVNNRVVFNSCPNWEKYQKVSRRIKDDRKIAIRDKWAAAL